MMLYFSKVEGLDLLIKKDSVAGVSHRVTAFILNILWGIAKLSVKFLDLASFAIERLEI